MVPGIGSPPPTLPTVVPTDGQTAVDIHSELGSPADAMTYLFVVPSAYSVGGPAPVQDTTAGGWFESVAVDATGMHIDSLGIWIVPGNIFGMGGRGGDGRYSTLDATFGGAGGGGGAGYPAGPAGNGASSIWGSAQGSDGTAGDDTTGSAPFSGGAAGGDDVVNSHPGHLLIEMIFEALITDYKEAQSGGTAIATNHDLEIYNAGGQIWGGGGGGSGGDSYPHDDYNFGSRESGAGGDPGDVGVSGATQGGDPAIFGTFSAPGAAGHYLRVESSATVNFHAGTADPLTKGTLA